MSLRERIDILFITHVVLPRDTGNPAVYEPLRMRIGGQVAGLPVLRALAAGTPVAGTAGSAAPPRPMAFGIPPVLTPFYLRDYMRRRELNLVEIPCLEVGMDGLREAVERGVGLLAFTTTWLPTPGGAEALRRAAAAVRAVAPGVPILVGGIGVRKGLKASAALREGRMSGVTAEQLADEYVLIDPARDKVLDAIVVADGGEATLAAVAERARAGRDFRDLPNLALPSDTGYVFTAAQPEENRLDEETVDWSGDAERLGLFDAPIRTATGCPFRCEFCDFFGLQKARLRGVESLIAELKSLPPGGAGPRRVFFADDNLALTRARLVEFARALIREKLAISWRTFLRADSIDAEAAELMRESGCRECFLGIESGDPRILANMNKRLDPEHALRAVEWLDRNGISTQCTFVVGFPGEDEQSIERTAAFISALPSGDRAHALQRYYVFRFQVLPLSPIAAPEQRERYGLRGLGEDWAHRTMDADGALRAVRELFLKVDGPSHTYMELVPPDWPIADTRRVMEARDRLQKDVLIGRIADPAPTLLDLVRGVESGRRTGA